MQPHLAFAVFYHITHTTPIECGIDVGAVLAAICERKSPVTYFAID